MPTPTVPEVRSKGVISRKEMELSDFEAALAHINNAIHSLNECVGNIEDNFYAHKCMDDHAKAAHRLSSMKKALEDRISQLRVLLDSPISKHGVKTESGVAR